MTTHHTAPTTTGRTISWARYYDASVAVITLGKARAIRRVTVALAEIAPGETVLDAGCGTGDLTMLAGKAVGVTGRVYGIDAAPEMIAVARRKARRRNIDLDYRVAAIESLPFEDASIDVVVNSLVMHHLPGDLKLRGLVEIRRVLRPGGRLLIVDLKQPTGHRAHFALPMLVHRHGHSETPDIRTLLESAGFGAIEVGETRFSYLGFSRGRAQ